MSKFMPEEAVGGPEELHVASLIVLTRPEMLTSVVAEMEGIAGVDLYAQDPMGKIIAVVEASTTGELKAITSQLETANGVMSASLVYHETMEKAEADLPLQIDNSRQETIDKKLNAGH